MYHTGQGIWLFFFFRLFKSILYILLIEFHCTFSIPYKILTNYVYYYYYYYYYCILIRIVYRPSGLHFSFDPALLFSILTSLVLPSSSITLSYFILAVLLRECLGKHSCMSPISYNHNEWYFLFSDSATTSAQCVFGAKK